MTNAEKIRNANKKLYRLVDELIRKEPDWGQGPEYELCMYTTRQILEMLLPIAEELA